MGRRRVPDKNPFEWKIGQVDGVWTVIDYRGNTHTFEAFDNPEAAARQYIDRDKRMISVHSKQAEEEMYGKDGIFGEAIDEPTVDLPREDAQDGEEAGPALNRADRRRVERLAGRQPSSRRGRNRTHR
jgi:hypothetical protein